MDVLLCLCLFLLETFICLFVFCHVYVASGVSANSFKWMPEELQFLALIHGLSVSRPGIDTWSCHIHWSVVEENYNPSKVTLIIEYIMVLLWNTYAVNIFFLNWLSSKSWTVRELNLVVKSAPLLQTADRVSKMWDLEKTLANSL